MKWGRGSLAIHLKTVLTYSNVVVLLLLLLFKYCQQRKYLVSGKMAWTLFLTKSCLCVRGWSNEINVPFVRENLFHLEKQKQELQPEALQPQRVSSQPCFPGRSRKRKWRHRGSKKAKSSAFFGELISWWALSSDRGNSGHQSLLNWCIGRQRQKKQHLERRPWMLFATEWEKVLSFKAE